METTHIRVTEEMKQKLDNTEGQNYDERIKNYSQDPTKDVNKNVNKVEEVEEIKSQIEDVNKKLTKLDIQKEVEKALPAGMFR